MKSRTVNGDNRKYTINALVHKELESIKRFQIICDSKPDFKLIALIKWLEQTFPLLISGKCGSLRKDLLFKML